MRYESPHALQPVYTPSALAMSELLVQAITTAGIVVLSVAYDRFRNDAATYTLAEHFAASFTIALVVLFLFWMVFHRRLKVMGHTYASPIHKQAVDDARYLESTRPMQRLRALETAVSRQRTRDSSKRRNAARV